MKRVLKFLLPIMILTVLATLLLVPASAAEGSTTVYAVWSSEEDYLANPNRPLAKYATDVLKTDAIVGYGYVRCYSDIVISEQVTLQAEQHLTIDLGGNKLTAKSKLMINGTMSTGWHNPGSVTIKNGTLLHTASQFLQPRPNSEIYLENLEIFETTSNNFLYDGASVRVLYMKNCVFNIDAKSAGSGLISLAPVFSGEGADLLYKDEEGHATNYVRNIIFENTQFIDNRPETQGYFIRVRPVTTPVVDYINISFLYGSGFNQLNDNFLIVENDSATVNVNIVKGAKFATEDVPVNASNFEVNYYDSATVIDNRKVVFGKLTDLYSGGDRNPVNPELIWGKSGDEKYPYQLCQYLCDVTWNIKSEHGEEQVITESGYADGLMLSYAAGEGNYYTDENGKVWVERHMGWSTSPDSEEYSEVVTLNNLENTFYAVFKAFPVYAVEYDSPARETIISGITVNVITADDIDSFSDGSYIYIFENVTWGTDMPVTISGKTLTFDLGKNVFGKNRVISQNSGLFNLVGSKVTFTNGTLMSSRTGIASLNEGSELVLDNVNVSYDASPAVTIADGTLTVTNAIVSHNTTDNFVPFIAYTLEGSATAVIENSSLSLAGPLSTVIPADEGVGAASLSVSDCGTVYADSIFMLSETLAPKINEGAALNVSIDSINVVAREIFDDCESNLDATYAISGACMFTAKPMVENGELVLPLGLDVVAIDDGEFKYTLGLDEISIKFNMELSIDLKANFYISADYPITYTETYLQYQKVEDMPIVKIDGEEFYVVTIYGISAADAFDALNLRIGYTGSDNKDYASEISYEPATYFGELLAGNDPLNRKLSAAAVKYIAAAYEYKSAVLPESLVNILESEVYQNALRTEEEIPTDDTASDFGNIAVALESAQLYLSSKLYVRFNLKDTFTGTLNIAGCAYTVENGKCEDYSYIQVEIVAYTLYSKEIAITGTAADGTAIAGAYSLSDYIRAFSEDESTLGRMLDAFYAYCYEAFVYDNGGVLPPYIDHTPPLDAELS